MANNVLDFQTGEPIVESEIRGALVYLMPSALLEDDRNERGEITPESDPELASLAESIAANGVLEPIRVYLTDDGYKISSGHRRRAAAILAGVDEVPVYIVDPPNGEKLDIERLVANIQRKEISSIALAFTIKRIREEHPKLTQAELARSLGMSQPAVANLIRLLRLPDEVLSLIYAGKLSAGHGLHLLRPEEDFLDYTGRRKTVRDWQIERASQWAEHGPSVHACGEQVERELSGQRSVRAALAQQAEWNKKDREREAEQKKITPEELEVKKKEERREQIASGRARSKRVKRCYAALREAIGVFAEPEIARGKWKSPTVDLEHIRFIALALNRNYLLAETRANWGLPKYEEVVATILAITDREELLVWCGRLALARMLEVDFDGKSFHSAEQQWGRVDPIGELADKNWRLSDAIRSAQEPEPSGETTEETAAAAPETEQ